MKKKSLFSAPSALKRLSKPMVSARPEQTLFEKSLIAGVGVVKPIFHIFHLLSHKDSPTWQVTWLDEICLVRPVRIIWHKGCPITSLDHFLTERGIALTQPYALGAFPSSMERDTLINGDSPATKEGQKKPRYNH
jgi:hypothetical protein